jgi:hypothetical protein
VGHVTRMCTCAAPAEAGQHCKLFGPGAACCFGGVFFRAITRVCCLQSIGAMANASRRQQDTMVSKSKYWSAVRLAPGSHPSSELVRTHTYRTPPEHSGRCAICCLTQWMGFTAFALTLAPAGGV